MNANAYDFFVSPIGILTLEETDGALSALRFGKNTDKGPTQTPLLRETKRQLEQYFAGELKTFDLPLLLKGTLFREKVWRALLEIPYGSVISYKQIAETIGHPKAYRAVGMANHNNPVSVIVPCHRVIAADGSLGGYGAGLSTKQYLLDLEQNHMMSQNS